MADLLSNLAQGLKSAGGTLSPQVYEGNEREALQRSSQDAQLRNMLLNAAVQHQLQTQSPQYQAQMEALKNERGFRQAMQNLGPNATEDQVAKIATQWGKPEIAMQYAKAREDRAARIQQANDVLQLRYDTLNQQKEIALQRAQDQKERDAINNQFRQQSLALQAQIAQGNQALRAMSIDIQRDRMNRMGDLTPEQKITFTQGNRDIAKDEAQITSANQVENALKRFKELNLSTETGRIVGRRPATLQPNFQELTQLENWLQVNNFKPGQGQISNFERSLMKGAGPQTLNDREANDAIIDIQLGALQNAKDRVEFKQAYLDANKSLLGADAKWNRYIEDNPRFVQNKEGKIVKNENRKTWSQYFGSPTPQPSSPKADSNVVDFSNLPKSR